MRINLLKLLTLMIGALAFIGCRPSNHGEGNTPRAAPFTNQDTIIKVYGDYNGDGKKEYMWLDAPEIDTNQMSECKGPCECLIRFSDKTIPTIKKESCIGGLPRNLGDLNGDGADDVGLLPDWFTSCWRGYYSYSCKGGHWHELVKSFDTHCNYWDSDTPEIRRDTKIRGHILIRYAVMDSDGNMNLIEKSVKPN